jgi:hypothetical protein
MSTPTAAITIATIARTGYQKYVIGMSSRSPCMLLFILISPLQTIRVPCGSIGFSKSSVAELPVLLVGEFESNLPRLALDHHDEIYKRRPGC